jgi:serine/threonine protein phosphatase PrpC
VVVQALREAFLRTDADLAGTEVGEVVGTTAVTAVLSQGELFVAHCGESCACVCGARGGG